MSLLLDVALIGGAWVQVTVHKPAAVRGTRDVGVRIERGSRLP